ncbi:MAG: hypothetical protein CMJ36_04910 [Phycisphaerae bacterium]|nr:hypothetical protein [Phycisphaerae bacterium]
MLRQHVLGICVSIFLGGIIGVGAFFSLRYLYPLYSTEVMFEVRPGLVESTDIGTSESMSEKDVSRVANTQALLMKGRDVLSDAVANPGVRDTGWMQEWFIDPETGTPLEAQAVDDLIETLSTPVIRNTNLFSVRWSWHNAQDVPIVLNAIAQAYLRKIERLDNEQFSENEALFQDQLRGTRLALGDLNEEIQGFILTHGITTLDDPRYSQAAFESQKLTEAVTTAASELTSIQTQYMQTAAKLEGTIEPTHEDILEAEYDVTMQRQLQTLQALKAEERSVKEQFNPNTPQVRTIERQVRATELQIESKREEVIRRNLNAKLKTLGDQRTQLQDVIESLESEIEAKDTMLRDLASSSSIYDSMVEQRTQLEGQRNDDLQLLNSIKLMKLRADAGRVRLVNFALTPRELSFPRPEIIIPAGVVLTLGCFIGIIFLREIMNQKIRGAGDLAIISGATIIGTIPEVDEDPTDIEDAERAVSQEPQSIIAESYRQAWTALSRTLQQKGFSSLLVTSGMPGSGATTVVSNLADSASGSGISVAVVDANFRRPCLASVYDIDDDSPGLGDVLNGAAGALDVVQQVEGSGISVVSAGTPGNRVYDRFADRSFDEFMATLRGSFGLVIIDTAPAIAAGDALVLADRVDATCMVIQANREERGLVSRLINQFNAARCELLGVVLNRPRRTAGGYFKKNYELMASYTSEESDD